MHPFFLDVKNLLFDTLFPIYCLGCSQEGLFLCSKCQKDLQRVKHQQCIICKTPSVNGLTHPLCKKDIYPHGLISILDYQDPLVAQTIIWGKYKFLPDIYRLLAKLMIEYIETNDYQNLINDAVLCPIPLAKQRLRWRGFNQSEILCRELSVYFGWPTLNLLLRVKNTKTQKDLSKKERRGNINGSFELVDNAAPETKPIIIIDDVITSGSTLLEASKTLKSKGFNNIWCLALARD